MLGADQQKLQDLAKEAEDRNKLYLQKQKQISKKAVDNDLSPAIYDNSKKAFFKEFKKVIEEADVILQVLDARDPVGSRAKHVEQMILEAGANQKRLILVLNKIDLIPKDNLEAWLKVLRNEYPTIAFKASTQSQRKNIGHRNVSAEDASDKMLEGSGCIGADNLVQLLKNYCRNSNIKKSITVGIVGYPNVGKSSIINSLKRTKVCNVGSTPGVTKSAQLVNLDKNIKLLDCPGIVFSEDDGQELLLRNCLKLEQIEDPVAPVEILVSRFPVSQLMVLYNIPEYSNASEFLLFVAKRQGKLRKGGLCDIEATARAVLKDWNSGKIPFYTVPAAVTPSLREAAVVSSWGKEFDLDSVMTKEKSSFAALPEPVLSFPMAIDDCPMLVDSDMQASSMLIDESKSRQKKKRVVIDENEKIFSAVEEENNPRVNKAKKADAKKQKKAAKKIEKSQMECDDEEYDFRTDFKPLPGLQFNVLSDEDDTEHVY